jgi:sulfite reductase beta subunit-like hemoprotein
MDYALIARVIGRHVDTFSLIDAGIACVAATGCSKAFAGSETDFLPDPA